MPHTSPPGRYNRPLLPRQVPPGCRIGAAICAVKQDIRRGRGTDGFFRALKDARKDVVVDSVVVLFEWPPPLPRLLSQLLLAQRLVFGKMPAPFHAVADVQMINGDWCVSL